MQLVLPRRSLLINYKSFTRSHLDYGDAIYDQPFNASFSCKTESVQCNAALAVTGAIKGSSRDTLYQELGLEYLQPKKRKKKKLYSPYSWMGFNCLKATEPLRGDNLLFTTWSPGVRSTHLI